MAKAKKPKEPKESKEKDEAESYVACFDCMKHYHVDADFCPHCQSKDLSLP
jgi:hypothetical protein